jgi:hypothetical protein
MKSEVLRPFLEKSLADWARRDEIEPDPEGHYAFRRGSAQFFVTLTEDDPPVLRLWSVLLRKVKPSPKVFRLLNVLNAELLFVRLFWKDNSVVLNLELPTGNIDSSLVHRACDMMGVLADELDTKLKEDLGGRLAFPDESEDEDAVKV